MTILLGKAWAHIIASWVIAARSPLRPRYNEAGNKQNRLRIES